MAVLLCCSCRFGTGGVPDGGVTVPDSSLSDVASEPPAPDGGSCAPDADICCGERDGGRACQPATNSSVECSAGVSIADRACPPGSTCEGFLCALDAPCQGCDPGGCGLGEMCSVFVTVSPESTNFCCTPCFAAPLGCGAPGTRCGGNDQCASGICIVDDGGGGGGDGGPDGGPGQCYYHCQVDPECGDGGTCESRRVKVDGRARDLETCRRP